MGKIKIQSQPGASMPELWTWKASINVASRIRLQLFPPSGFLLDHSISSRALPLTEFVYSLKQDLLSCMFAIGKLRIWCREWRGSPPRCLLYSLMICHSMQVRPIDSRLALPHDGRRPLNSSPKAPQHKNFRASSGVFEFSTRPRIYVLEDLPLYSTDVLRRCHMPEYVNQGFGPVLGEEWAGSTYKRNVQLHQTDMRSFDVILYHKLMNYSGRVEVLSEADFVYAPFFFGALTNLQKNTSCNVAKYFRKKFRKPQLPFTRQVVGGPIFDSFLKDVQMILIKKNAANATVLLSLSRTPRNYAGGLFRGKNRLHPIKVKILGHENFERSRVYKSVEMVPYPTFVHASSRGEFIDFYSNRTVLVTFASPRIGKDALHGVASFKMRENIARSLSSLANSSAILLTGLNFTMRNCYQAMQTSVFSLQPPGDSPVRRGFYDSILLGCIPVIFSKTAYNTFGWTTKNISVVVPKGIPPVQLVKYLQTISQGRIQELQHNIKQVQSAMQYSLFQDEEHDAFGIILRTLQKKRTNTLHSYVSERSRGWR